MISRTYPHGLTGLLQPQGTGTPAPQMRSISPNSGPAAGGTPVTITGRFFNSYGATAPSTLTIGGTALTSVVVVNDTTITGTTGAMTQGTKDVVLVNNNGNDILRRGYGSQ